MACGTVITVTDGLIPDNTFFGITSDEAGLVTQSITIAHKSDEKEARDKCGKVVAVAFYNERAEIQIEGLGERGGTIDIAENVTLANDFGIRVPGSVYIDEITLERTNEDFMKTSIKATAYKGLPTGP